MDGDAQGIRELELEERQLFHEIHYTLTRAAIYGVVADQTLRELNRRQRLADVNRHRRPSRAEVDWTLLTNDGRIQEMQRLNARALDFINRRRRILRELEAVAHHDPFWVRLTLAVRVEVMWIEDWMGETARLLLGPAGLRNGYSWFFVTMAVPRGLWAFLMFYLGGVV